MLVAEAAFNCFSISFPIFPIFLERRCFSLEPIVLIERSILRLSLVKGFGLVVKLPEASQASPWEAHRGSGLLRYGSQGGSGHMGVEVPHGPLSSTDPRPFGPGFLVPWEPAGATSRLRGAQKAGGGSRTASCAGLCHMRMTRVHRPCARVDSGGADRGRRWGNPAAGGSHPGSTLSRWTSPCSRFPHL